MRDFNRDLARANACKDAVLQAKMYEQLAKQGCAEAQYQLANCYHEGRGVAKDNDICIGWLRQAAAAGHEAATLFLGGVLLHSEEAAEVAEGERICRRYAEQGEVTACTNLGNHYYYLNRDAEAAKLFRRAAEENFAPALYQLGQCYFHGYGVEQNRAAAYRFFLKAAEQGHIPACYWTALCCHWGEGTAENAAECARWLRPAVEARFVLALQLQGAILMDNAETQEQGVHFLSMAAEQGEANSMFLLYSHYQNIGDDTAAATWLRRAAEAGHREAQCDLGHTLMQEARSPQEEAEAFSWLQQSAEKGDTLAEHNLGIYYEKHPDLPDAEALAFRHFREAAARDHLPSVYLLSRYYIQGISVRRNRTKGYAMLRYAADGGYPNAAYTYGLQLLVGDGVPADKTAGRHYLSLAMKGGCGAAAFQLALSYAQNGVSGSDRNTFCRLLKTAAQLGEKDDVYELAQELEANGHTPLAADVYTLLADLKHTPAMWRRGYLLYNGLGVQEDKAAAMRIFRRGAQLGDSDCMVGYASMLAEAGEDFRTRQRAFLLWKKAAAAGHPYAELALAKCYDEGDGVRQNFRKANELYHAILAKREDCDAAFNLAYNYYFGSGIEENNEKAVHYFRMAHRLGSEVAPLYLGRSHLNGWGVEADGAEAVRLLREAADHGVVAAMEDLADIYAYGTCGQKCDLQAAARWWHKGAEAGSAFCMFNYGICLNNGEGVRRNYRKALEWFRRGAELNHAECIGSIGWHYFHGKGVKRDYAEAVACFRRCLELKDEPIAAYNLAKRYFHGQGVEQSDAEALRYFLQSSAQHYADADVMLGYMYEKGRGTERDFAKAVAYYRRAAKNGCTDAAYELGRCYEHGIGVAKNLRRAVALYHQAADKDHASARRALKRLGKAD